MTATRRLLACTAAAGAMLFAGSVSGQPMPPPGPSPEMTYEYAVPQQGPDVVYHAQPVIQPLPAPPAPPMAVPPPPPAPPMAAWHDSRGPDYRHESYPGGPPVAAYGGVPPAPGYGPLPPNFDRNGWLADCRARVRGVRNEGERATIIGGLLGAITGGVIGNRVYDTHRTAGTLIGAGVGGLAGLAIGAAIDAVGNRRRTDECELYLERYAVGGSGGPGYAYGYGAPGYGYNYGYGYGYYGYAYVPVLVPVAQRQVVREYVTEEWVDVPVRTVTRTRVIRHRAPAPRADKRLKIIKR